MKNILSLAVLVGLTAMLFSCGSGKQTDQSEKKEQTELPPSLKPEKEGSVKMVQLNEKEQNVV